MDNYSLLPIRHSPKTREETTKERSSTMQLQDVAVLITGGGSGLGAATARAMAAKGAKIGVIDQNKENAEKVAAEVKGVALHADVTDEEAIKAAIAKAEAAHGIARVLMNCAGIGGSQRTVGKDGVYPLAKFVRIINVNLIGTFNVLRLFAERLATAPPIGEERDAQRRDHPSRRRHPHGAAVVALSSSPRKRGPILRGGSCCRRSLPPCLIDTTRRMGPGSRFAWPGRRWMGDPRGSTAADRTR